MFFSSQHGDKFSFEYVSLLIESALGYNWVHTLVFEAQGRLELVGNDLILIRRKSAHL